MAIAALIYRVLSTMFDLIVDLSVLNNSFE